ncbi:MAG: CDP-archaeol synthase [Clostridia bacterium]|nr:CDP-archaeol synthase [Clostridia bacterium]
MLKRSITGACYVAVMVAFFLLRELLDARLFHIFTCCLLIAGTVEIVNALKNYLSKFLRITAIVGASLIAPCYCAFEYLIAPFSGFIASLSIILVGVIIAVVCCTINKLSFKKNSVAILPFIYPALFLTFMLLANDGAYGFIVLLLSFVVSPLSDTFAYLVGCSIGGKKLCPKLSPKKTWSGAIGGTVGGIVGALVVYFIFTPTVNFFSPALWFGIVGFTASIVNIFGDLFESYIKRKVGIKDMGKILPGHGGVMDRIDGTLFAVVWIYLLFLFV